MSVTSFTKKRNMRITTLHSLTDYARFVKKYDRSGDKKLAKSLYRTYKAKGGQRSYEEITK